MPSLIFKRVQARDYSATHVLEEWRTIQRRFTALRLDNFCTNHLH